MEPIDEGATQESSRGGSWQVGWTGAERGQAGCQPRKRPQGRRSQKPQEDNRSSAQRTTSSTGSPEEIIESVIAAIRPQFGDWTIGLGDHSIRAAGGR
jgi:hypothetical protein